MKRNFMTRDVFIFMTRDRIWIKLLVWDRSGFVIWCKRLEEGTFELPQFADGIQDMEVKWERLVMILEGIQLASVKERNRYSRSA